jgi:hypothetical protein
MEEKEILVGVNKISKATVGRFDPATQSAKLARQKFGAKGLNRVRLHIIQFIITKLHKSSVKIGNWCWDTEYNKLRINEKLYPERYDKYLNELYDWNE